MIVSISIIILIAILGSIYYKFEVAQTATEEKSVEPNELENKETQNTINEKEEPLKPQSGNGDEPDSAEDPSSSSEQPIKERAKETPPATEEVELENGYIVGQKPATEPTFVKGVLIANKKNPLPATYNKGKILKRVPLLKRWQKLRRKMG